MHIKRLSILLLCLIFVSTPVIECYAAVNDDILWQPLNSENELVDAFQAYCKSRDLTIEGSIADAVTTATTGTFNGLCNKLGIDMTALQADIKKSTDSMGNIQYLFDSNGITAYNRIFAQFLQDNELEVGDPADKSLYDGQYGTDLNGNGFLFYVIPRNPVNGRNYRPIVHGSTYIYNNQSLVDLAVHNNNSYRFNPFGSGSNNYLEVYKVSGTWRLANASGIYKNISGSNSNTAFAGNLGIAYVNGYTSDIRVGLYTSSDDYFYDFGSIAIAQQQSVNITIVSPTINNNTYEGDTIINQYGTPSDPNNPDDPDPDDPVGGTPPNWDVGGGDGTLTDPDGNTWNINFPDFELPDLNIDWSINGLGNKFPFSIPFDLVALVTVLNAEPEAPRFQGTVNFGFTTWDYDINLQSFDTVASVCRIAELLLLVFGLIMVTRSIIKG